MYVVLTNGNDPNQTINNTQKKDKQSFKDFMNDSQRNWPTLPIIHEIPQWLINKQTKNKQNLFQLSFQPSLYA